MSDSQIEEIKNKLNVLDIVGSYVKLTKTGVNYRGICPFHSEKGPSFFVSPSRQMWKCFGCSAGGDIFEFIKKIEGVEFGDALRILAAKAGVELKRENPQIVSERKRLYEICDLSCSFFEKQLTAGEWGKKAKEYLLKRGIKEETIKKWRLGYSPDTWQGLSDFLVGRGYKREEIVKAGLAVEKDPSTGSGQANSYDRFRGRIIFPIFDINSQVIGFGARIFKEADKKETAKYINTPQTMLYDKSNVLYGINYAKLSVRKKNQCVLTEGYTDAIMCHQAGFENTVAVSGTALTGRHLNLLKRYSDNLLLAFDMDLAGDTATKRGINMAESQGFNIKIIDTYSGAKDPAEIIAENPPTGGPKNWENSVANARSIMDYYFDSAFVKFSAQGGLASGEDKKQIAAMILPAIKRILNKIEQSYWIQKLSEKLGVSQEAVLQELAHVISAKAEGPERAGIQSPRNDTESRKQLIESKIISLVIKNPEDLNLIEDCHHNLFCEKTKSLIEKIKKDGIPNTEDYKDFFSAQGGPAWGWDELALKAEVDLQEDGSDEVSLCILQLKDIYIRERRSKITAEIKTAEQEKNLEKVNKLIGEFNLIN